MSQTFEFYDIRAKESEAAAQNAGLAMVRERELRSAATWRGLADRAHQIERDRTKAEEARGERRAAEAADLAAKAHLPEG
ncbi:hypothetical protein [Altericroceibacterium xinjiangense]|uniref:hypothetical protein n=1 Tax=Altericroceibacterium xinjiangense TaxID=762261 RepID=UPI000F7E2D64|nr:hypothetical protein [Altericroceibacterium xinjiangense]